MALGFRVLGFRELCVQADRAHAGRWVQDQACYDESRV